jgi:hypothetical protein
MAVLKTSRTAQYPLLAEFVFNFSDTMLDVNGASKDFGSSGVVTNNTFRAVALPPGAVIIGGELIVETAYTGSTAATINVGDASSAARFLSATDLKTAGRTAIPLTTTLPMAENTGTDIQIQVSTTVAAATAGKARVRILYTVDNRANEVQVS